MNKPLVLKARILFPDCYPFIAEFVKSPSGKIRTSFVGDEGENLYQIYESEDELWFTGVDGCAHYFVFKSVVDWEDGLLFDGITQVGVFIVEDWHERRKPSPKH